MFSKIYALPIGTMILIALTGTVLWILTGLIRDSRVFRGIRTGFLFFITALILDSTLLGRSVYPSRRVSLIPFASFEAARVQPEIYRSLLLNFLMFLPFGLCIAWILPEKRKSWQKVLTVSGAGFALSVVIEAIQYFFALGLAETDDVIFNTLGCVFASGAMLLRDRLIKYRRRLKTHPGEDSETPEK